MKQYENYIHYLHDSGPEFRANSNDTQIWCEYSYQKPTSAYEYKLLCMISIINFFYLFFMIEISL